MVVVVLTGCFGRGCGLGMVGSFVGYFCFDQDRMKRRRKRRRRNRVGGDLVIIGCFVGGRSRVGSGAGIDRDSLIVAVFAIRCRWCELTVVLGYCFRQGSEVVVHENGLVLGRHLSFPLEFLHCQLILIVPYLVDSLVVGVEPQNACKGRVGHLKELNELGEKSPRSFGRPGKTALPDSLVYVRKG